MTIEHTASLVIVKKPQILPVALDKSSNLLHLKQLFCLSFT